MKSNLYIMLALSMLAASCNKEITETGAEEEITFTEKGFSASVSTKASAVTGLSSFNVMAVKGTMGSSETSVFNAAFTGSSTYKGGKYWPSTDQGYKFYASNATMTPAATGAVLAADSGTDIVCAVLPSPSYKNSNSLTFNHIFARVGYCDISAPSGYTVTNLTVKITPKTSGQYNLFKGNGKTDGTGWSSTVNGAETTIANSLGSATDNGLYLVPGTYTITARYDIERGEWKETGVSKTASVGITGGKINNITATLPAGNAEELQFTVTLNPWGTNNITGITWN